MSVELKLAEHIVLETDRLKLRPFKLSDAEDLYTYASDDETARFVTFERHTSVEDSRHTIAAYYMGAPLGKYALELKSNARVIGAIDIRVDAENATGELGYVLNKAYTGLGYMHEAASKLLELGFEVLNLNEMHAFHDVNNTASERVLKRLNMRYRGVLPSYVKVKGNVVDYCIRSLTREDYFKRQASQ
ncbi:GNAT family N-acetyltransferase [Staphylococcus massiliensis]|uniref:Acetyltransferase n=1 Tax=Staphylococcus massiliensis S46 TaxID=1229783 RepID=K9ANS7_9STAP|nr:GNAT family protein [Staphylococcus massiliensis]EKU49048.1 acetyltransferase [Staphylococcus massiliensis S46]MCG3399489.1 GNAT family N-acetyltransferase [Staphylococcus massiliensis]MCG3402411.1 GNAT family N-acetyltransferase [Staphylococcus massiliensis]MCG3411625.1 GNAT family N-acetyltransferase [Staphylococcus massiliensis]POA01467.1 N-acetyltransferase [Staphylococcus massiliensis CCUG 55927]